MRKVLSSSSASSELGASGSFEKSSSLPLAHLVGVRVRVGVGVRVGDGVGVRVRVQVGVKVSVRVSFPLAHPESASASLMYCAVRSSRACSRRTTSVMRSPATFLRLLAANSFQKSEMYLVVSGE